MTESQQNSVQEDASPTSPKSKKKIDKQGSTENEDVTASEIIQKSQAEPEIPGSKVLLEPFRNILLQRQKDPIYLIKPVALVEENQAYDYEDLEESLINMLLEKVVVMREVPFLKAIEQLERNANVKKIYEQISKVHGVGAFAGRQNTKRWQQALANRDQFIQTKPYEGPATGLG